MFAHLCRAVPGGHVDKGENFFKLPASRGTSENGHLHRGQDGSRRLPSPPPSPSAPPFPREGSTMPDMLGFDQAVKSSNLAAKYLPVPRVFPALGLPALFPIQAPPRSAVPSRPCQICSPS